jgi:ATP-dependent RNA helicase DeaD
MTFQDFSFKPKLAKAVADAGFKEPSPVQKEAIPLILEGKDIVAQAHTGTGKTAAFGLPIINLLQLSGEVEALIIVPTRELAIQVSDEIYRFGKYLGINTATVYGGSSYNRQLKHIQNSAIVVATPGRLLDLLKSGKIDINPTFVVLDEADEMLDMGFLDDIQEIFDFIPSNRHTMLFSATMPEQIKTLAHKILSAPEFITITKGNVTNANIKQYYYVVDESERDDALIRLLDYKNPVKSIVFCRMKKEVDRLSSFLISQGFDARGLHGDMDQRQREEVMRGFKKGEIEVLIATDVAARGLDVQDVSHVFNYHIPFDSESYVHRIGRTGRAGKEGMAISIITPHEFKALTRIQKSLKTDLEIRLVPTKTDVADKNLTSLKAQIISQEVVPSAYEIVEALKEEIDVATIAYKLASMAHKELAISGNETIGKNDAEITKLFKMLDNEQKAKKDGKKNWSKNRRRGHNKPNQNRQNSKDGNKKRGNR